VSDYRPVTDVWILGRPKIPYWGAYLSGFLGRARAFLCREDEPLLHVCGGRAKDYPFSTGLGPHDRTIDLDPECSPDFLMDVRKLGAAVGDLFPLGGTNRAPEVREVTKAVGPPPDNDKWPAALIDRPYTAEDASKYQPGVEAFPESLNDLLRRTLDCVRPGGRVGVIDYLWPQPPKKGVRLVACIGVVAGFNNRMRVYSVFERQAAIWRTPPQGAGRKAATLMESLDPDPAESDALMENLAADEQQTPASEHAEGGPLVNPSLEAIERVQVAADSLAARGCAACGGTGKNSKGGPCRGKVHEWLSGKILGRLLLERDTQPDQNDCRPRVSRTCQGQTAAGRTLKTLVETPVSLAPSSRGTGEPRTKRKAATSDF